MFDDAPGNPANQERPHSLNCAKLMPGGPHACSCRQLPSANSPEGRKHELRCNRIDISSGKYDAEQPCNCSESNVHNHAPDEGPGLSCPEYNLEIFGKTGACRYRGDGSKRDAFLLKAGMSIPGGYNRLNDFEERPKRYAAVDDSADPEHSHQHPTVPPRGEKAPPVDSETRAGISGEVRTTSVTGGQKGAKEARFDLIPPEALRILAVHYGLGAAKYADHNWRKGFEWSKAYAALNRHLTAFWGGEDLDPETGSPHMAAVAWHAFTLLTFMQEQRQFDDRFKKVGQ